MSGERQKRGKERARPPQRRCPSCSAVHDPSRGIPGVANGPLEPGSVVVCADCGEIAEVAADCVLLTKLDPVMIRNVIKRRRVERASALAREQATRRRAQDLLTAEYLRSSEELAQRLDAHLAAGHGAPSFGFPPGALMGCLDAHGWLFARDASARVFLAVALLDLTDEEMPTITMLRTALERREIPVHALTWDELRETERLAWEARTDEARARMVRLPSPEALAVSGRRPPRFSTPASRPARRST